MKDNQRLNYITNLLRRAKNIIISAHQETSWEGKKIQSAVKKKQKQKQNILSYVVLQFINSIIYWDYILLIKA